MAEIKILNRADRIAAYEQTVKLLRDHALIYGGAGGVLLIVHPDTQDEDGIMDKCLRMAQAREEG